MFITTYSSLQTTSVSSLYKISHKDDLTVCSQHCCNIGPQTRMSNILFVFLMACMQFVNTVDKQLLQVLFNAPLVISHFIGLPPNFIPPKIFSFQLESGTWCVLFGELLGTVASRDTVW